MRNYNTDAINLKSYKLGEADKIIVLYTKDYGIVKAVAKGCRRTNSKLGARADLLIANKVNISKGKNLDIFCQAEVIDSFKEIRKDINKLTYAMYVSEVIGTFGLENDNNSEQVYNCLFEALKNISMAISKEEIFWAVIKFQQKYMKLIGYQIELNSCVKCNCQVNTKKTSNMDYRSIKPKEIIKKINSSEIGAFSSELGGILCKDCKSSVYKGIDIDNKIMKALKESASFDFAEKPINETTLLLCFNILKDYISKRSHKKIKSEEFINCLC